MTNNPPHTGISLFRKRTLKITLPRSILRRHGHLPRASLSILMDSTLDTRNAINHSTTVLIPLLTLDVSCNYYIGYFDYTYDFTTSLNDISRVSMKCALSMREVKAQWDISAEAPILC